ncbi:hypothetical protein CRG98_025465 [Punica granatum]|uniref:Uncharacterized protein n=1 Tax=Punica granatum TaxID=22663 RepID=A0A2I0JDP8_PUNGR|nr:hypothetical protein CRG98_025465 [Punica granatum]
MEESRLPIGGPEPRIDQGQVGGSRLIRGSGPPISDLDPSTEVASVLCGCRQPRWRDWGRRLEARIPNRRGTSDRSSASSVGAGDLGGGVEISDWQPRTPNRPGTSRRSSVDSGFEDANQRPRPLHRSRWHPLWAPVTSVEGSGWLIGGPDPSSPFDFRLGLK